MSMLFLTTPSAQPENTRYHAIVGHPYDATTANQKCFGSRTAYVTRTVLASVESESIFRDAIASPQIRSLGIALQWILIPAEAPNPPPSMRPISGCKEFLNARAIRHALDSVKMHSVVKSHFPTRGETEAHHFV